MAGRDVEILLKARDDASAKIAALEARIAQLDRTTGKAGKALDEGLTLAKAAAGLQYAGQAARVLTEYLESSGTHAERLQEALQNAGGVIGDLSRFGATIGKKIWGPSNKDVMADLDRLTQENNRKLRELDRQEKQKAKEKEARLRAQAADEISVARELAELQKKAAEHDAERWDKQREAEAQIMAEHAAAYQAEVDRKRMLAGLDSELAEARLRLLGKEEQAERESINRRYADRLAAAEDANDAELADRLKALRDAELAGIGRKKAEQEFNGTTGAFESRTATRAVGFQDRAVILQQQQLQRLEIMARGINAMNGTMERVLAKLPTFV